MTQEKRKLPRFHITPCQYQDHRLSKTFAIQDISRGGLSLRVVDREDLPEFAVATLHQGLVKVEGRKLACTFKVKHIRGVLVGAEWVDPEPTLQEHLERISHPERLGVNLKKYEMPDLNALHWFHNPVGVDLLFYRGGAPQEGSGTFGRWMLYIHQNFIQWESDSGVQTGRSLAEAEDGYAHGIVRLETRLIEYHPSIDRSLITAAKELVEHAPIENPDLKNIVLTHLNGVV